MDELTHGSLRPSILFPFGQQFPKPANRVSKIGGYTYILREMRVEPDSGFYPKTSLNLVHTHLPTSTPTLRTREGRGGHGFLSTWRSCVGPVFPGCGSRFTSPGAFPSLAPLGVGLLGSLPKCASCQKLAFPLLTNRDSQTELKPCFVWGGTQPMPLHARIFKQALTRCVPYISPIQAQANLSREPTPGSVAPEPRDSGESPRAVRRSMSHGSGVPGGGGVQHVPGTSLSRQAVESMEIVSILESIS